MQAKPINHTLSVSDQLVPTDMAAVAAAGFRSIICNRPDGEAADQPSFAVIEAAAEKAGLVAAYLPVTTQTLDADNGAAFGMLMAQLPKPVLAYCRSGARSTSLAELAAVGAPAGEGDTGLSRRALMVGAGSVAAATAAYLAIGNRAQAQPVATKARIAIIGGGAAGLTTAAMLAARLTGGEITVYEPSELHSYQPGWTLVGAGVKAAGYTKLRTADFMPAGVKWVKQAVSEIDPDARTLTTADGVRHAYDYVAVCTGLTLRYDEIVGMSRDLIGKHGIMSVYGGEEAALASFRALSEFAEKGGVGLFGRPATEMKCAGAPLKQTLLSDDHLRRKGIRDKARLIYNAHNQVLFSVPVVTARVEEIFKRQQIEIRRGHRLTAIDPGRKIATYATAAGNIEEKWDLINVIPPMRAPEFIRQSPLSWKTGNWVSEGWMEVDRKTLRHVRYDNVFGIGDIAGVPKGKTAASVKWQVPVAVDHLVASIAGRTGTQVYDGYTSCPLITRIGSAMLVEFNYHDQLVPSFPLVDPLAEGWLPWVMKDVGLKPAYAAMLRGHG
jgi:sulfide:quinone oxidoreductase